MMTGFETVASTEGIIIGFLCGLIPFGVGVYHRKFYPAFLGLFFCTLSGFACGLLGGLPMILLTTAVVISHIYVDVQDPFTSRASLEEVNFEESRYDFFMRSMASLGNTLRAAAWALVRNKVGFIGFLGIMFFFVMTVFGPLFIEYEGSTRFDRRQPGALTLLRGPSEEFPLGLDWKGRSVLSQIVYGGQKLIATAVQAGFLTTLIAVVLGAVSGLVGGIVDQILSAIANFILTLPQFPLLLVLTSVITFDNRFYLALVFALLGWPVLMRAVRAQVLSLRERDYVQAAFALDLGLFHIVTREVLPNLISYIMVNMIFSIRLAMYSMVGLVFLGFVPLEEPDWGVMIYNGRQQGVIFSTDAASMLISPIVAIALFQLSLVLFSRSLEEIFNPRLRSGM